jgi:N-hydroxyarylamine O-acetyltransferase
MSICVDIKNQKYLLDVGYGDMFIRPLEIRNGVQTDGRNLFKIEKLTKDSYVLLMSSDRTNFIKKYEFHLGRVAAEKFYTICYDKQINSSSYFVKNSICTRPTRSGRLTLFNNKLILHAGNDKTEKLISDDNDFRAELKSHFGIEINNDAYIPIITKAPQ